MKPYYGDSFTTFYNGDSRSMSELPDEYVQMVCTSPPYWGLRKYSGEQDLIWGDNHCEHRFDMPTSAIVGFNTLWRPAGETDTPLGLPSETGKYSETVKGGNDKQQVKQVGSFCSLCGAWKGAFGLEPTPEMYVQHTIEILREIRRVLRKDGVVFWNIGDTYSATRWSETPSTSFNPSCADVRIEKQTNLPPKNLCLIPFRIAIAAQANGWYVRSVIIWSKPNPMPESVTDRPTESHEYILMLTKSKNYYWDADAVREPHLPETIERYKYGYKESARDKLGHSHHGKGYQRNDGSPIELNAGRNLRTVWEFPTQPYPEAHFAVFPEKLPELCIKAATPEVGCCSKCGKPWVRIRKPTEEYSQALERLRKVKDRFARPAGNWHSQHAEDDNQVAQYKTLGWQPSCNCKDAAKTPAIPVKTPSIVLDPFMGTGTTLWVAKKLGRRAVGYDISEEYCRLALERNRQYALEL